MNLRPTLTVLIDDRRNAHPAWSAVQTLLCQRQVDGDRLLSFTHGHPLTLIQSLQTDWIAFIPADASPRIAIPDTLPPTVLMPWMPEVALPTETAIEIAVPAIAWIAATPLVKIALPQLNHPEQWTILHIATVLENQHIPFNWGTTPATTTIPRSETLPPSVLAIIPHYRCEAWLTRCLRSLLQQTRPPDRIVVVDDGSAHPPVQSVEAFPTVTLLASSVNVGPYRLIQQVIEDTSYDAYLFQDADDWSAGDRLAVLLQAMAATGAELVGTQEWRVGEEDSRLIPVCYPLDVNRALAQKPGHPLLHPTSIVTRNLVMRLGGFATGLRFGGDTEFLLRAAFVARIVNVPYYGYFRRKRPNSLTTRFDTGLQSPARQALLHQLKQRAIANHIALDKGDPLCLTPLIKAEPIALCHVAGAPWVH